MAQLLHNMHLSLSHEKWRLQGGMGGGSCKDFLGRVYLFERCGTEDFPCRAQISCWPASPARVRYLGCAASAVASASAIPSDGSVEDLVRAGVLLHQLDVTVPSNAAISLLTGLAAVQRADGHRVLAGCRKLRCVYAFRTARTESHVNLSVVSLHYRLSVVHLHPSSSGPKCSFSGAYEPLADISISAGSSQRAAFDALECVRQR